MFCGLIYKIRQLYQRNFLLQFHNVYVPSVMEYGLIMYGSTRKPQLENIDKAQRRILRGFFFQNTTRILVQVLTMYSTFNIYELYIFEDVNEVLKQLKSNSPYAYLSTNINFDYNTRRKTKGLFFYLKDMQFLYKQYLVRFREKISDKT